MTISARIRQWLWRPGLAQRPLPLRMAIVVARYIYGLLRELFSGQLTLRAMSLVYITLLSIVPLLAFCFAIFKGFGTHNNLKDELYTLMDPLGEQGVKITDWVINTVDNVEGSVLGTLSLAFFVYTAIAMVQKVEASFNYVWHVDRPRSLGRRVSEYLSILLIGPLAMAIALSLIATLSSHSLARKLGAIEPFGSAAVVAGKVLPYLLVIGVFTFVYKFLPNAKVRLRSASIGGLAAGVLWAFTGALFASFVAVSAQRNAIYSTFAVAISALIWLYVSWLILLIGALIAFYHQNPLFLRVGRQEPSLANGLRERIALNTLFLAGTAFRESGGSLSTERLSRELNIPGITLAPILNSLEQDGLLVTTDNNTLVPGREMSRIQLNDILAAVRDGGDTGALQPPRWSPQIDKLGSALDGAIGQTLGKRTLSDLIDAGERNE